MAFQPRPVMVVKGNAIKVEKFDLAKPDADGVVRQGARVHVFTELPNGAPAGFAEIYVPSESFEFLPDRPSLVEWVVEVGARTARGERRDGSGQYAVGEMSCSFVGTVADISAVDLVAASGF